MICLFLISATLSLYAGDASPSLLRFEEEWRISSFNDDVLFGFGVGLDVDAHGFVTVTDLVNDLLYRIDPNGKLIKVIGGPGQGPGELPGLIFFKNLDDGRGVALCGFMGSASLHFFDKNLVFLKRQSIAIPDSMASLTDISRDGRYLMAGSWKQSVRFKSTRQIIDLEGNIRIDLGTFQTGTPMVYKTTKEHRRHVITRLIDQANEGFPRAVFSQGTLFLAKPDAYHITRYDKTLTETGRITRDFVKHRRKPMGVTRIRDELWHQGAAVWLQLYPDETMRAGLDKGNMRPFFPPIVDMVPMDDGRLLVVRGTTPSGGWLADLFSAENEYLGEVSLPDAGFVMLGPRFAGSPKLVLRNGQAYALAPNEDLEFSLIAYRTHEGVGQ